MDITERKARLQQSVHSMGKLPPQVLDLEEKVLCSIIDDDSFIDVSDILKPHHFYTEAHQKIMESVVRLFTRNDPIDIATVTNELRVMGMLEYVGGAYYIANIVNNGLRSGTNIEYHSKIIIQKFLQRELIRTSTEAIQAAYEDTTDIFELMDKNQDEVSNLRNETHKKSAVEISDLFEQSMDELDIIPKEGLTGVGSGFIDLDNITGGWQSPDLIIIAARPAMGKTAFVLSNARNAAVKYKKPVGVFSLEMSSLQLTNRLISDETSIHLERILKKRVTADEKIKMRESAKELKESPLIIDDTAGLNIFEFRAKCRRLKMQYDIQMIVVDYLQLMTAAAPGKFTNRDHEIGMISRALKSVAKELNVPVLALSQLSRAVESRPGANGKRPRLSDLRESGNIEQDADMVIFLHRPEYYGITQDEKGDSTVGLCECIIAKHRNGVTDTVNLDFNGAFMRFRDFKKATAPRPSVQVIEAPEFEFGSENIPYDANKYSNDNEAPF